MTVLLACMYIHHVCAWCPRNSEEGSDLLDQESQTVVSRKWMPKIKPKSSARAGSTGNC